ncbi:MAG TPA: hypothetical protein VKR54_04830 [Candidatus Babeliales bacterium]|jgi:hypothetical protein|nr:hypothetical protein [Candidatus Babeliales bacterium]
MMKKNIINVLLLTSLTPSFLYSSEQLRGISNFSPRSQDINAARDVVGWHPLIHRCDAEKNYSVLSFTPMYNQSLRPERIDLALFNSDTFSLSGSQIPGRAGTQELLADYFGLAPDFASNAFFKPLIRNLELDMALYIGFDTWVKGLYFQLRGPAVWTQWNLKLAESNIDEGTIPYPAGYMAEDAVIAPYNSFTQAMKGLFPFGEVEQLKYGKICGAQKLSGLAALEMVLGYDFIRKDSSHVGFNFRASAPTGSRPKGEFFFEPRVGCGKHWQIGVGFTGHTRLWEKDGQQELIMWVDANFTNMLKARQRRSFDFCQNGFFSRYILVKEFDQNGIFTEVLLPAINITTLDCNVRVSIQVDMVFMFGYTYNNFVFDIGYNGWIRSREKISLRQCIPANTYGLKGVQFAVNTITEQPNNTTESSATIFETQPIVSDGPFPVFISTRDLNVDSAASPLILTQKLFWHFSNSWPECRNHTAAPFFGIGAEIEFEGINSRNAYQPANTTMGQASVWLKGGVAF